VAFAKPKQPREVGGVAVHAENGIREHQDQSFVGAQPPPLDELRLEILEIPVAKDAQVSAPGLGGSAAVHKGGVVQGIGEHGVSGLEECGDEGGIALVAGIEEQAGLGAFPESECGLQLLVQGTRAPEQPGSSAARAEILGGPGGGLGQAGVLPEAQVVVGAEIDPLGWVDDSGPAAERPLPGGPFESFAPGVG